jgi:hypothetical protein
MTMRTRRDTVMAMVIGMVTGGAMTRQQPIGVEATTF